MNERQLELKLGGVDSEHSSLRVPIETEDLVALHQSDIYRNIKGSYDTVVTERNKKQSHKEAKQSNTLKLYSRDIINNSLRDSPHC